MTIYLLKGFPEYAATSLADAQALFTALGDQTDSDNLTTIAQLTAKLPPLIQADEAMPLTISSIDAAAGTISSWVTDAGVGITVGLGDPDANGSFIYAESVSFTIGATTRTGELALNTSVLQSALAGTFSYRSRIQPSACFTLHIRLSTGETVGLLRVQVLPGVLGTTSLTAIITPLLLASKVYPLPSITGLTGGGATKLDGITTAGGAVETGATVILSYGRVGQTWQLIAGTDAEAAVAGIVRPDDYHASTNARIWIQLS